MIYFFFNDTATTEIYTLSLHDALPISSPSTIIVSGWCLSSQRLTILRLRLFERKKKSGIAPTQGIAPSRKSTDRKSTRLNSSHANISYAVFCLTKKYLNILHHNIPQEH